MASASAPLSDVRFGLDRRITLLGPLPLDCGAALAPVQSIADMVRAQALLLDYLGIPVLSAVIGGSMGGMQAISWPVLYPDRVRAALVIASTARHSAQNIAFHEVGRQAIMADPRWRKGAYYADGDVPASGLAVARMAAHITYLSEAGLTEKFGRRLQDKSGQDCSGTESPDCARNAKAVSFGYFPRGHGMPHVTPGSAAGGLPSSQ